MYYTYVVRPGEAAEGRGPYFRPFWDNVMNFNLRGGFALQFVGYLLLLSSAVMGGNFLRIFPVLSGETEALKRVPLALTFLGSLFLTLGSLWLQNFRSITDDDGSIKESRGFRSGTKLLQQGSLLDIISWTMTSILLFSLMHYFEDTWTVTNISSGSTAIYALIARSFHGLTSILYGMSFFLLENFHTMGSSEAWGWILCFTYCAVGLLEFMILLNANYLFGILLDFLFTCAFGLAIACSLLWALTYEPVVSSTDVKLTQSAMRIEFFKSKNAMAYYGPPISTEMVTCVNPQ